MWRMMLTSWLVMLVSFQQMIRIQAEQTCFTDAGFTISDTLITPDRFGGSLAIQGVHIAAGFGHGDGPAYTPYNSWSAPSKSFLVSDMNIGSVYVFSETSVGMGDYSLTIKLSGQNPGDQFGHALAFAETTLAIAATMTDAPLSAIPSSNWPIPSWTGWSENQYTTGTVYIFAESSLGSGDFTEQTSIVPADPDPGHQFGTSLAFSGRHLIIGSRMYSSVSLSNVYVYSESNVGALDFSFTDKLENADNDYLNGFGLKVDVDEYKTIVIGAPYDDDLPYVPSSSLAYPDQVNAGAVYVFRETSADSLDWSQTQKLIMPDAVAYYPDDVFSGSSVASRSAHIGESLAVFGTTIAIGSENDFDMGAFDGAVYIFQETSLYANDFTYITKVTIPDDTTEMRFGDQVALYDDLLIITAPGARNNFGLVAVFREISPGVFELETEAPGSSISDVGEAGGVMATHNGRIVVSAQHKYGTETYALVYNVDCIDDCVSHVCEHGSTCVDGYQGYTCACFVSHEGDLCETCTCENGGFCDQIDIAFDIWACDCTMPNLSGAKCNKQSCNNGFVQDTLCNCTDSGATGKFCELDIDDCDSSPCLHDGECSDFGAVTLPNNSHEFNCSCVNTGYHGTMCEIEDCISSPCLNNGVCTVVGLPNGIECNCTDTGYEGDICDVEINECLSFPCENQGTCIDIEAGFTCDCGENGYTGAVCSVDIDDCASSPCLNNGTCIDKGKNKFQCNCDNTGFEGLICDIDIDECILRGYECENGGVCQDDTAVPGNLLCDCSDVVDFTGQYCELPTSSACDTDNICLHGGYCYIDENDNVMRCDCLGTGYSGDVCDVFDYISECASNPCLNDGRCVDASGADDDWECTCINGYMGVLCADHACEDSPCFHGGTCMGVDNGNFLCDCTEDWEGATCEENIGQIITNWTSFSSSSSSIPDLAAEELSDEYETVIICDSTATQDTVLIGLGGCAFLVFLIWQVLRQFPYFKNGIKEQPTMVIRLFFLTTFFLTCFDFVTNINFISYISNSCTTELGDSSIFTNVVGVVLGIQALVNYFALAFLIQRDPDKSVQNHVKKHIIPSVFACIIVSANVSAILLLDSNLLGITALTGNFNAKLKDRIKMVALGTVIAANLPQVITQLMFLLTTFGSDNSVTWLSLGASGLLLLISTFRAMLLATDLVCGKSKPIDRNYDMPV